ncbi:MAG: hypothetical protein FWF29_11275 [Treponema sp.]|nr:hypothetical protein [Treponema sp.]
MARVAKAGFPQTDNLRETGFLLPGTPLPGRAQAMSDVPLYALFNLENFLFTSHDVHV